MRGRKPKPTKLKILNGNPWKRRINKREPRAAGPVGTCPAWLSAAAKAEWKRIVPVLQQLGMAASADRAALTAYCQAWAELEDATKQLTKEGRTVQAKRGTIAHPIAHPAVARQKAALAALRAYSSEFGLTPASRSRIQLGDGEGRDELDDFLNAPSA
jgi:P27 family predicted phage terminase small subunit